jgi:hypothetical protein
LDNRDGALVAGAMPPNAPMVVISKCRNVKNYLEFFCEIMMIILRAQALANKIVVASNHQPPEDLRRRFLCLARVISTGSEI